MKLWNKQIGGDYEYIDVTAGNKRQMAKHLLNAQNEYDWRYEITH